MKPATVDLTADSDDADAIYKGITYGPIVFQLTDDDDVPVPLTGYLVFAEVRKQPGSPLILDLNPQIVDDLNAYVQIAFTDEETFTLPPGNYKWDFIMEKPTGERVGPFISGKCDIIENITEPPEA